MELKKGRAHTKLSRKYHGNFSTFFIASDKGVTEYNSFKK